MYRESVRGFLIFLVITSHAILLGLDDLTFWIPFLRLASPSVFLMVYMFGYSQGKKGERKPKIVALKALRFFVFYSFWASVSFVIYCFLGDEYQLPYIGRQVMNLDKMSLPLRYSVTIFTFSGSWQYYFVFVIILLLLFSCLVKRPERWFKITAAVTLAKSSLVSLWFLLSDGFPSPLLGVLMTYFNPAYWMTPFFLGWKHALSGGVRRKPGMKEFLLYFAFFFLGLLEFYNSYAKFGRLSGVDQFSLSSVLLAFSCVRFLPTLERLLNSKFLAKLGRFSFLVFMVHLPFQWMVYVYLRELTGLNRYFGVAVMVAFTLLFVEAVLKVSRFLPRPLRKAILGA